MRLQPYLHLIFRLSWRQKKKFLFLASLVFIEVGARLIQPYLYKILVDSLTAGLIAKTFAPETIQMLISIVAVWFLLAVFNNLSSAETQYLGWQVGNQNSQWVHLDGYKKLLRLDYFKHTQKHSSRYAKIVDEADTATWEMTNWWLNRFFPATIGFIGMLIIAISVSVPMTLLSIAVIPPGLFLIMTIIKRNENEQQRVNKLWNLKHEHLSDQITNIITYKLNQRERLFLEIQKGFSDRASNAQGSLNKKWRLAGMLNPEFIARFLVMGMGIFMVKDGNITLGTLFMFMGLLNEILTPLQLLGDILPQYSRRARHIDRFLRLVEEKDQVKDPEQPAILENLQGKIEFRNVSFRYPGQEEKGFGINGVSFAVAPGQHIALVGHSGAGKSTIVALVTRLIDPTSGKILVDDKDIRDLQQEDYRRFVGTVLQEHSLYNETIAQNIAYGKFHATREEIIMSAKTAEAHEFIEKLPQGYDTLIGERGVRLSGGEKQRLSIARAILKNPRIVILDEPTSALDSITEAKVQKALEKLMQGRTTLTIAHRLSTVRDADIILMVHGGKIMAIGNHRQLMRSSAEYKEMVELQTGGFIVDEDEIPMEPVLH